MAFNTKKKFVWRGVGVLAVLVLLTVSWFTFFQAPSRENSTEEPIETDRLIDSIAAAGEYILRDQQPNGALAYRVTVPEGNTNFNLSYVRLIAGTGSLYTACRVLEDDSYCDAGDQALDHYLDRVVEGGEEFGGSCLSTSKAYCNIGGTALAVDAIYKRWQVTGETSLGDIDLLAIAEQFGDHIVWMRKPEGGLYHRFEPDTGVIDEEYFVVYFNGESLMALLELYEMTEDQYWLEQAREINAYMLTQPVRHDHWHAYAFSFFARLDTLTEEDIEYADQIADAIIKSKVYLKEEYNSISAATKIEALASIALAFQTQGISHTWLIPPLNAHAEFIIARQLPNNLCGWGEADGIDQFVGGIYYNCEEPYIRIDAQQHWINGAAAYLDYISMDR